jgi:hypothetical protein
MAFERLLEVGWTNGKCKGANNMGHSEFKNSIMYQKIGSYTVEL